jgi:hypothetical protein
MGNNQSFATIVSNLIAEKKPVEKPVEKQVEKPNPLDAMKLLVNNNNTQTGQSNPLDAMKILVNDNNTQTGESNPLDAMKILVNDNNTQIGQSINTSVIPEYIINDANTAISNIENIVIYLKDVINAYKYRINISNLQILTILLNIVHKNVDDAYKWKNNLSNDNISFKLIYRLTEVSKIAVSKEVEMINNLLTVNDEYVLFDQNLFKIAYNESIVNMNNKITDFQILKLKDILNITHSIIFMDIFINNIISNYSDTYEEKYKEYSYKFNEKLSPVIIDALNYGNDTFNYYITNDIDTSPEKYNILIKHANMVRDITISQLQAMNEIESVKIIKSFFFTTNDKPSYNIINSYITPTLSPKEKAYYDNLKSAINADAFYNPFSDNLNTQHISLKCQIKKTIRVNDDKDLIEFECISVNNNQSKEIPIREIKQVIPVMDIPMTTIPKVMPLMYTNDTNGPSGITDLVITNYQSNPTSLFNTQEPTVTSSLNGIPYSPKTTTLITETFDNEEECSGNNNDRDVKIFVIILLLLLLIYLFYLHNKKK